MHPPPYNVLSRLKGIETFLASFEIYSCGWETYNVLSRLKGIETRRFVLRTLLRWRFLTMSFPVWRELKPNGVLRTLPRQRLQCPFPFEGNWNAFSADTPLIRVITYNVLSRLKGIETKRCSHRRFRRFWPYNVLSRLKGIETLRSIGGCRLYVLTICLQCPFPFEGNWNGAAAARWSPVAVQHLTMSFPVWRELKLEGGGPLRRCCSNPQKTYNVLSRLKGIETFPPKSDFQAIRLSYNVLSRLKGIETPRHWWPQAFSHFLTMSFPVWRELKQDDATAQAQTVAQLTMSFPVWRELKHFSSSCGSGLRSSVLQCPFPFEGNWNHRPRPCSPSSSLCSYNVLSRLKGIETISNIFFKQDCDRKTYNVLSRLKGIETNPNRRNERSAELTMSFPVWRELKHLKAGDPLRYLFNLFLQCPFPFEGNWNGSRPILLIYLLDFPNLQCPFPFEGNWNFKQVEEVTQFIFLLQCPFPFEGNWNKMLYATVPTAATAILTMSFPVWRELKLPSYTYVPSGSYLLTMSFPVWRELKPSWFAGFFVVDSPLTMSFPVWRELKRNSSTAE